MEIKNYWHFFKERWMTLSGGKPQFHLLEVFMLSFSLVGEELGVILTPEEFKKSLLTILVIPFACYFFGRFLFRFLGQRFRGYIPESLDDYHRHRMFWYCLFLSIIEVCVLIQFVSTHWPLY